MYVSAPAWMVFILTGAGMAAGMGQQGVPAAVSLGAGVALFVLLITLSLFPKLMGLAQVLGDSARSADYGGRGRVVLGGMAEIVMSMLIAPIVALALTRLPSGCASGSASAGPHSSAAATGCDGTRPRACSGRKP